MLALTPVLAAAAAIVDVPAGNTQQLFTAIHDANESGDEAVIRLTAGIDYQINLTADAPEPILGHLVLIGNGAHITGKGADSYGPLFDVTETGQLEVSDLVISGFSVAEESPESYATLIRNDGEFLGKGLRIEDIHTWSPGTFDQSGAVILNNGAMELRRVRISNVTVVRASGDAVIVLDNFGPSAFLENVLMVDGRTESTVPARKVSLMRNAEFGRMYITYSSLILESTPSESPPEIRAIVRSLVRPGAYPIINLSSSIILDLGCPYDERITSLGFNLISDDDCYRDAPSDQVGVLNNPVQFHLGKDGGIELTLPPASRALDAITDPGFACALTDAIGVVRPQDGDGDGQAWCDIGAFENPPGNTLFSGGENGLFYTADMDGHYVTIQKVRPNEYVITWNTFDLDGKQAWITAVGSREGDVITAKAFFQPEGRLLPGGGADVNTDALQEWGNVTIELLNCLEGEFTYVSTLNQFGSGSFKLDRLAYLDSIGCQDG